MSILPAITYQFGPFLLESGLGLSRAGQFVALPPKELSLLETLVLRRGEVVSHNDLWDSVWPGQEASNDSITRCIYQLRRALGGGSQTYIGTVPRRGYRMVVPVVELERSSTRSLIEKSIQTSRRAYASLIEGSREANLTSPEHQQRAVKLFENAHRLDAQYAVPLGAIAECRVYQTIRGWVPPDKGMHLILESCEKALEIDPSLVSAIATRGWVEGIQYRNAEEAIQLIDKALELDPEYTPAYNYRAWVLRASGRLNESVDAAKTALELDPHSLYAHAFAWSLFCAGKYEEALAFERRMAAEASWIDISHGYYALTASWLRVDDEANAAGARLMEVSNNDPSTMVLQAYVLVRTGREDEARMLASQCEDSKLPYTSRSQLAMVHAELGDRERVIALLRKARDERCPWFPGARYDPRLGKLASDPDVLRLYE